MPSIDAQLDARREALRRARLALANSGALSASTAALVDVNGNTDDDIIAVLLHIVADLAAEVDTLS